MCTTELSCISRGLVGRKGETGLCMLGRSILLSPGSSQNHARTTVCLVTSSWHAKSSGFNFPPWSLKCHQSLPVSLVLAAHIKCLLATLAERRGMCGIRAQQRGAGSDPREVGFASSDGTFALRGSQNPTLQRIQCCDSVDSVGVIPDTRNNASRVVIPMRVWMCVRARMHMRVCMYIINYKEPDSLPAKTGDCFLSLDY